MVTKEFHWCLLNFLVKSHFHYQLLFYKKNVLQHKTTANESYKLEWFRHFAQDTSCKMHQYHGCNF